MRGKPIEGPIFESLRLFAMCDQMKWNHLPAEGGIYDQHPRLLSEFQEIFHARAEQQKREDDERERKAKIQSKRR